MFVFSVLVVDGFFVVMCRSMYSEFKFLVCSVSLLLFVIVIGDKLATTFDSFVGSVEFMCKVCVMY